VKVKIILTYSGSQEVNDSGENIHYINKKIDIMNIYVDNINALGFMPMN